MKLQKINLKSLADNSLCDREMNAIKGGTSCGCSCIGPSSSDDNRHANYLGGQISVGGCLQCWECNGGTVIVSSDTCDASNPGKEPSSDLCDGTSSGTPLTPPDSSPTPPDSSGTGTTMA